MKKSLFVVAMLAVSLAFFACSSDSPSDETPAPTSGLPTKTVTKGADYEEDVSIDLSSTPLKAALSGDVTSYFSQSQATARAAVSDTGITNFRAVVKTSTTTSVTVTISGTAPATDCKIVITVTIPASETASGKPVVKNATVVNVGAVSAEVSSASTTLSVPANSDLAGKIFAGGAQLKDAKDDKGQTVYYTDRKYFSFGTESGEAVPATLYWHRTLEDETTTLFNIGAYSYKAGTLTYTGAQDENDHNSDDNTFVIRKAGDTMYLIEDFDEEYKRTSGSGLFATFTSTITKDQETETSEVTLTSDGVITGTTKDVIRYSDGTGAEQTYTTEAQLTGTFINNGGVLSCNVKITVTTEEGEIMTIDMDDGLILYDGSQLYFVTELIKKDALPTATRDFS